MTASRPDCLFVTGATGFIGGPLIARFLSAQPGHAAVALVRDPGRAANLSASGVRLVAGDVTRPQMGLPPEIYTELSSTVTGIIHAAGDINFGAALPVSRAANVFGTQQAINFARCCPNLQRFIHLSTISIHGTRPGPLLEEPSPAGHRFVNSYQQSKHEAEWVVLRAMRDVPAEIIRLSLIAADSIAGAVSQFNYVHHLLRYLPNNPLPIMPGDPGTCVDLLPADWTIAALAYLFDHCFEPGAVRNLSAGPSCSLTLHDAMEIGREVMEPHFKVPVRFPQLAGAAEFQRMLDTARDNRLREAAAILGPHINLLSARQSFENARTASQLRSAGLTVPSLRSWFANMIEYCLETNWGDNAPWSMIQPRSTETFLARQ